MNDLMQTAWITRRPAARRPSLASGDLRVEYLPSFPSPAEDAVDPPQLEERGILGIVSIGSTPVRAENIPSVAVATAQLGPEPLCEVWSSPHPAEVVSRDGIEASRAGEVLFGIAEGEVGEEIGASARRIYREIIEFTRGEGVEHLVRMWNYFPRINDVESLERYQQFCVGRYEAFEAGGLDLDRDLPAGSAVGTAGGPLVVTFVACSRRPRYLENPRQISAFRYPRRYGPRSPSFARGALLPDGRTLVLSGTASIRGHESMHPGSLPDQFHETMRNIDAVIEAGFGSGASLVSEDLETRLKVYIRSSGDQPRIADLVERALPEAQVLYLQADICRSELLLEIEGLVSKHD
jgi:chorismate lyase / 3-hydroxybenzoate synthase